MRDVNKKCNKANLSRFSDVSEKELNALIQKINSVKTKIAKKYGIKNFKGQKKMNLKYQFNSFTRRIIAGVSSTLVVCINSIIVYQKSIVVFLFLLHRFLLKQLEYLLLSAELVF